MDIETKNNLKLRQEIIDLGDEVNGDIDHAECFYDLQMLNDFCTNLDRLKNLAREYYVSNRKELD